MKRQKSDVFEDEGTKVPFNRIREGTNEAALEPFTSQDARNITLSKKDLEAQHNSTGYYNYNLDYVKSNVRVRGGKWYFEVRLQSPGSFHLGWCSSTYHPQNGTGHFWGYDLSGQQKTSSSGDLQEYGTPVQRGDIIGCALDLESKSMQFWRNGEDLGVAHSNVILEEGLSLLPYAALARRAVCIFNFGRETFAFPQEGFNALHSYLSEAQLGQLGSVYVKYRGKEVIHVSLEI